MFMSAFKWICCNSLCCPLEPHGGGSDSVRVVYFTEVFLCVLRNRGPKPQDMRTWPKQWKPFDENIFVLHYTMSVGRLRL